MHATHTAAGMAMHRGRPAQTPLLAARNRLSVRRVPIAVPKFCSACLLRVMRLRVAPDRERFSFSRGAQHS